MILSGVAPGKETSTSSLQNHKIHRFSSISFYSKPLIPLSFFLHPTADRSEKPFAGSRLTLGIPLPRKADHRLLHRRRTITGSRESDGKGRPRPPFFFVSFTRQLQGPSNLQSEPTNQRCNRSRRAAIGADEQPPAIQCGRGFQGWWRFVGLATDFNATIGMVVMVAGNSIGIGGTSNLQSEPDDTNFANWSHQAVDFILATQKLKNRMKCFYFLVVLVLLLATSLEINAQTCKPSGGIRGKKPPRGQCNTENDSDCCVQGDGGGPSECDKKYHSDDTPVVALSTGWYKGGDRCHKYITINGNGRSVNAMVVDECDSTMGCDADHDYQPPCPNNIVDASKAVWKALGVSERNWGDLDITWTE
ncbi:hypothetical protein LXL04_010161 [Taraxacum kok-saghyz]